MEGDEVLMERPLRIENKQLFVDLKRNASGVYLKLSSVSTSMSTVFSFLGLTLDSKFPITFPRFPTVVEETP
jgi:hypothetical protein